MILHAASFAAFFLDQVTQAPVVVQCVVSPSADPGWKQWIPTAISLLSVGIGLWIANRSIRNARELTEWSFRATSEKDHKQWLIDQKKAEWKDLLGKTAEVDSVFQRAESPNPTVSMDVLIKELASARLELKKCWSRCLFIADVLRIKENKERYLAFDKKLDEDERKIRAYDIAQRASVPNTEQMPDNYIGNQALLEQLKAIYEGLKEANDSFGSWILSVAQDDLEIKEP